MDNHDISRLGPSAQRQILAELLKPQSGTGFGDIMRKVERNGIQFTIPLNPVSKKNSSRVVPCGKYHKVLPSKAYVKYEERAEAYIPHKGLMISRKCEVTCLFYMKINYAKTKQRVDLVNLLEAIDDVLVTHHLLVDDSSEIIGSHDGSRVLHDKDNPRTEVTIRFMDGGNSNG